jgi:hypothetical protein
MKAQPGHLAHSALHLKQSEKVHKELSKAAKAHYALKKIQPVLDWRRK